MGWGIRKSVRIGFARINFSRRGIGTSFGVRGLRLGVNARGKTYVAGGRGPFWFRKTLSSATPRQPAPRAARSLPPPATPLYATQRPPAAPQNGQGTSPPNAPAMPPPHVASAPLNAPAALPVLQVWEMSLIALANVVVWATAASDIGIVLWLIALADALIRDWPGLRTLRGLARAAEMTRGGKTWYILGWIFIAPIFTGIYAVRGLGDSWRSMNAARLARPQQIARLEADLGMQPPTEGACRHCGRPAVAGAEFCAYCGQPLAPPKAQVCPQCATLAPPDARFCPRCGGALAGG